MSTLELPISGMTCASCANRVERRLNKLDGVSATVNYATEKAAVEFDPATVGAGAARRGRRGGGLSAPRCRRRRAKRAVAEDEPKPLRDRLVLSALLSLPVLLISMIPALQFDNWQWLALNLATPVVLWGGWPFHRAAWANLRHGAATMDTLISLGTLAAWLWSLYALFLGDAGMHRDADGVQPDPAGRRAAPTRSTSRPRPVVTTFILAGRYFEARAKRRAGAALKALLELGAKDVAVLDRRRHRAAHRHRASCASASASSCAPARRSPPTASSRTARRPST